VLLHHAPSIFSVVSPRVVSQCFETSEYRHAQRSSTQRCRGSVTVAIWNSRCGNTLLRAFEVGDADLACPRRSRENGPIFVGCSKNFFANPSRNQRLIPTPVRALHNNSIISTIFVICAREVDSVCIASPGASDSISVRTLGAVA